MKNIFSLVLFFIVAVSVSSAQSKELNLRVGETANFTTAVRRDGGLTFNGSTTAGNLENSKFKQVGNEQFKDRVKWDNSTGFFSISNLKMEDSGEYRVKNDANEDTIYKLTVDSGAAMNWQTGGSTIWMMFLAVMVTSHSFLL